MVFSSCREDVDAAALQVYDGPMNTSININLVSSDSAIIRSEIKAAKQLEFENGNLEFPEGIDITFFDKAGNITTTMRADRGYYLREDNLYKGEGDVQVDNLEKDQSLKSEEIFWNPNQKKMYTEKFVSVRDGKTLLQGAGLEADENFSKYSIKKPMDSRIVFQEDGK